MECRGLCAPGILVGAVVGAQIAGWLPTFWLSLIFAGFVGFSAFKMFLNKSPRPDRNLPGTMGKFFMGIAIGILSALVGAGGGFISVPWMVWCNVKMQNAVATSAAFGFPIALFGTIGYIISGWNVSGLPPWPIDLGYILFRLCSQLRLPVCFLHRLALRLPTLSIRSRLRRSSPACCASSAST